MSEDKNEGEGLLQIDDALVTVLTKKNRIAAYLHNLVAVGREGAVIEGASLEQLAELDEAIQWLSDQMKG